MGSTLLLMACVGAQDGGDDTASPDTAEDELTLFGFIHEPGATTGIADVLIVDLARPSATTRSDDQGTWALVDQPVPYVTLRFTHPGLIAVQAWIDPLEAVDPQVPYPMSMGGTAALESLYGLVGAVPEPGKALLFVDAMDPQMRDIQDARVEISSAYQSAWQEYADGAWAEQNLTTGDRTDLMFLNVEPGPVTLSVTDPDGAACTGPTDVVLVGDELTQVSYYCAFTAPTAEGPRPPQSPGP